MKFSIPKWCITEVTGYEPKTTFWMDFSIADKFGLDAVKDTFNRAFNEWKGDYIYLTELTMVFNHKCWEHYNRYNEVLKPYKTKDEHIELSKYYKDKYYELREYGLDNLKGEELTYFIETLD